ncbi:MAG: SUMF1/EgtB/PvdO family nonheme iron enzyme [Bacteroidota bacterium]
MDKENKLNQLFESARNEQPLHSFDALKLQFEQTVAATNTSSSSKSMSKLFNIKNLIIMIVSVSMVVAIVVLTTGQPYQSKVSSTKKNEKTEKKAEPNFVCHSGGFVYVDFPIEKTIHRDNSVSIYDTIIIQQENIEEVMRDTAGLYPVIQPVIANEEYVFPRLTAEEVQANHKQKREMIKSLEKIDKKTYSHIASGSFDYNGKLTSVQTYLIGKMEVTNLEYRTFLFDLLIQERKEEFLKAKPDQSQWTKLFVDTNKAMENNYFSHEAYNDYPVVNISREGAEMYCKWLTQELNKMLVAKGKDPYNDLRIPTREEWVMAASYEGKVGPYPWNGEFPRNSKGCYLANFKPIEGYKWDGAFFTAKVNSYLPNDFGLFNMAGNVAEMVYDDISIKSAGTAGGGWNSLLEEIKILGPDSNKGVTEPRPDIGFRVVCTFLSH